MNFLSWNSFKSAVLILAGTFVLTGCNGPHEEPNVELLQDMMEQPNMRAQGWDVDHRDKPAMRTPPEGTVPQGFDPYPYASDPIAAEKNLKNPLAGQMTDEVLKKGRETFETFCLVCHGPQGHGDGPVSVKMPLKPPSLVSAQVRNFKDGRIFHIITAGQGLMQTYATQITNPRDRWAVVNYVRHLQAMDQGH